MKLGTRRAPSRRSRTGLWVLICTAVVSLLVLSAPVAGAEHHGGQWDPLLPKVASAGAPGDPVAIAQASLQASAAATQTVLRMGRSFLNSIGILNPATGPASGVPTGRTHGAHGTGGVETEHPEFVRRGSGAQFDVNRVD